jgi:PKD repeat protein
MKSFTISVLSLFFVLGWFTLNAQIEHGGTPASFDFKHLNSDVDHIRVHPPDMNQIMLEDANNESKGGLYMVSRILPIEINMENSGTWTDLPDGRKIWRLKITSEGAKALSIHYNNIYLPIGSELYLYNENHKQVAGSFNHLNNEAFSIGTSTRIIQGETTWIEYVEAAGVNETPVIEIRAISYFYRSVDQIVGFYADEKNTDYGASGDCEVDVECPEGDNWMQQIRSVALIYVIDGFGGGFCSGTLVNNTANDGTPYFLSADHCGGDASPSDMNQWLFYFNYQAPSCNYTGAEPGSDVITGCEKRAKGPIDDGSDFLLLELNCSEADLQNINAYYCGWNRSTSASPNGVSIHHPAGDIKKIATYTSSLVTDTYTGSLANAHWKVVWVETTTNHGVTEQGSSGSAIFDNNKLLVGTLTGGGASCFNLTSPDYYGKFDVHWETAANGTGDGFKLEPWLDPNNTGAQTLQGREPGGTADELTADFSGNPTTVDIGGTVNFTDLSYGGTATSWNWEFEGGDPGVSPDQNPTVTYNTEGTYDVTLTVSDGTDNSTELKAGYIIVQEGGGGDPGDLNAQFVASAYNIFVGECVNFQDQSTGNPTSWQWTFDGADTPNSTDQNPTNICYSTPGTYNVTLNVENATDTDTETINGCITVEANPILPIAQFEGSPLVIPQGGVVYFTNLSENGPFDSWAWTFEGGEPSETNDSLPAPITYWEVGTFDVELRCENLDLVQDIELKPNYIKVIPEATEPPTANFIANYTVIQPGDAINFVDLSSGNPYQWEWYIEGGSIEESNEQNISGVVFDNEGTYDVQLIVRNNLGADTLLKEDYIIVKIDDPCTEAPIANFRAAPRLIQVGQTVYFEDLSENYPQNWNWNFGAGANPQYSNEGSPTDGVVYNVANIYDVSLSVNNLCGSSTFTKEEYIYVFSGPVYKYCDTLSNVAQNESTVDYVIPDSFNGWGWVGGHNSERIRYYADYFNDYTFDQIEAIIVPVKRNVWGSNTSRIRFYIWDAQGDTISTELVKKNMYLKDLQANYSNVITFSPPIQVDGPFYIGFEISNADSNNDGVSDDQFSVPIVNPRGSSESQNTMFVNKSSEWTSCVEYFGFATSLPIKPVACLLDIDQLVFDANINVYPNPTNDMVYIEIGKDYAGQIPEIKIYDVLGKVIEVPVIEEAFDKFSVNINNYPQGMYFINVYMDGKMITRKISLLK